MSDAGKTTYPLSWPSNWRQREATLQDALRESREAWADQLETDIAFSCPRGTDGEPDERQMDEAYRPMIEQTRALIAKIDAALKEPPETQDRVASLADAGLVIVPRVPTEAMIMDGVERVNTHNQNDNCPSGREVREIWQAMIDAARVAHELQAGGKH